MAIDTSTAAQAAAAAASAASATGIGKKRLAENFDTFLGLLTTQLKNQDPLSPLDANQFTQQIVQMTGVEQQLLSNDLLQKLVANSGGGVSTAVSLIGKSVRAVTSDAALSGGKADWVYKLDAATADLKVEVLDSNGKVVHAEAAANSAAGEHKFSWDGKDATGHKLPDAQYTLRLTAKDASGKALGATTYVDGIVTSVEQADGKTLLTINGGKVPYETINTVSLPPQAASTTADNKTSSDVAA
jgi:flagellar basal-body rod modification protein FlgD